MVLPRKMFSSGCPSASQKRACLSSLIQKLDFNFQMSVDTFVIIGKVRPVFSPLALISKQTSSIMVCTTEFFFS